MRAFAAGLIVMAICGGSMAAAQEPPVAAPYDQQLLRLSEILGALHYLRPLCNSDEGPIWRDQMQALIEAEDPDVQRRARMVDRFNRGHDSYQSVYRSCTRAAQVVVERYLEEGARISREVTARYGTGVAVSPPETPAPADPAGDG
jgi:uncharacterized protein (TIGR02301 family)